MRLDELIQNARDNTEITRSDLIQWQNGINQLFHAIGINVVLTTKHLIDRINDNRNSPHITLGELNVLFRKEFDKYGKKIAQLGPDAQGVLKDLTTKLNLPFVLNWDPQRNQLHLIGKTIMRKKDFQAAGNVFAVEGY